MVLFQNLNVSKHLSLRVYISCTIMISRVSTQTQQRRLRHLSAVIFIKLRHPQPLAPHSLNLTVLSEFRSKTVVAHLNSTLSPANQIIEKVNWILT